MLFHLSLAEQWAPALHASDCPSIACVGVEYVTPTQGIFIRETVVSQKLENSSRAIHQTDLSAHHASLPRLASMAMVAYPSPT